MGLGWSSRSHAEEVRALHRGLNLGMRHIDTPSSYDISRGAKVVAEVLAGRRQEVFLSCRIAKVHASRTGTVKACESCLQLLETDVIDLLLLDGESDYPLEDTISAFQELRDAGMIHHWGVSGFPIAKLEDCERMAPGENVLNEVYYNLEYRDIEYEMQAWTRERGILIMARSPLHEPCYGHILRRTEALKAVAARHGATGEQAALAWCVRNPGVVTSVVSKSCVQVLASAVAADMQLTDEDVAELDAAYPAASEPKGFWIG